jgi:hypothetical protein
MLIILMVERKLNLALYMIFLKLSTWKKENSLTFITRVFSII